MSLSTTRRIGRKAIAALAATAMLTAGLPAVSYAAEGTSTTKDANGFTEGIKGEVSPTGNTLHNKVQSGKGTVTVDESVKAGGLLTIKGTGFEQASGLNIKFQDGRYKFPKQEATPTDQDPEYFVKVSNHAGVVTKDHLPDEDGNFTVKFRIPENIPSGWYWVRLLNEKVTKYAWFKVTDGNSDGLDVNAIIPKGHSQQGGKTVLPRRAESLDDLQVVFDMSIEAVDAGTKLKAKMTVGNGSEEVPVKFKSGGRRGKISDTYTVQGEGDDFSIIVDAADVKDGKALAFQGHSVNFYVVNDDGTTADKPLFLVRPDQTTAPYVAFTSTDNPELANTSINSTAHVTIANLPKTNKVTAITAGGEIDGEQLKGGTNILVGEKQIGDNYRTEFDLAIPNNKNLIGKKLIVTAVNDKNKVAHFAYDLTLTADNTQFSNDQISIVKQPVDPGLYQSVYSAKDNALFVTRTDFASGTSALVKFDADTFTQQAIAVIDNEKSQHNVFGIGLDETTGLVWVTNTTNNTVAAYKASDLSLDKQFDSDKEQVAHPRAIAVNEKTGRVYVSAPTDKAEKLTVIDEKTKVMSTVDTPGFAGPMGMEIDPETGMLYTTSFAGGKILQFDTNKNKVAKIIDLGAQLERGTDVAYDHKRGRLYIAGQQTNNFLAVDINDGKVLANLPTGDQPVGIAYDKGSDRIVVVNRTSSTATVIDGESLEKVANLDSGYHPNFVDTDGKGRVFVLNKQSQLGEDKDAIILLKLPVPEPAPGNGGSDNNREPDHGREPDSSYVDLFGPGTTPGDNPAAGGNNTATPAKKSPEESKKDGSSSPIVPIVGIIAALGVLAAAVFGALNAGLLPGQLKAALPALPFGAK